MESQFSILHISDLHRISDNDIDCLISSFQLEKEEYRKQGIPSVKLIIVSGDIINGSNQKDASLAKAEITKQYDVALRFLVELTGVFLGKEDEDRLNVIIVPGNHDMSRYVSLASMEAIDNDNIDKLVSALWSNNSIIRWSWKDLQFHEIKDKETYDHRFDDFIVFYNSFYKGQRSFPTDVDAQSALIDIPEINMSVACFNSCYQLDHLRTSGYISPRSLSTLTKSLIEAKNNGRLIVAIWHHHTRGLPNENNYLDYTILDNMTQSGICLAFHGHQHVSGIVNEYKDVFSDSKLTMVSAGTLYGNSRDIPTGLTRQYNILKVDMRDEKCVFTLISRQDRTALNQMPAWECGNIGRSKNDSYTFEIVMPAKIQGTSEDDLQREINKINLFIEKTGDFQSGIQKLESLDVNNVLVRKILLDLLLRVNDFQSILKYFSDPQSVVEAIAVIDICIKTRNADMFNIVLNTKYVQKTVDPSLAAMIEEAKMIINK